MGEDMGIGLEDDIGMGDDCGMLWIVGCAEEATASAVTRAAPARSVTESFFMLRYCRGTSPQNALARCLARRTSARPPHEGR